MIGFLLGILPGGGAVLSSFVAYAVEKRVSKHPERFGTGMIEGVAAPEAANNSAAQSAFIPLLTLGLPANVVMALLLGALILHGVTPGPLLLTKNPDIFWGVVASMYLGNIMLLVLNLPLIGRLGAAAADPLPVHDAGDRSVLHRGILFGGQQRHRRLPHARASASSAT